MINKKERIKSNVLLEKVSIKKFMKKFITLNKSIYISKNKSNKNNVRNVINNTMKRNNKSNNIIGTVLTNMKKKIVRIAIELTIYHSSYKYRKTHSYNIYNIFLSYKKNRFFPYFYKEKDKNTIFNNSLGILSKRFSLKKSFLKSKNSYLFSASYIRRMLIYISATKLNLNIVKTPKYLKEILKTITTDSNVIYNHPFRKNIVNEKKDSLDIKFLYVNFINNKALGPVKRKKKGRLKRKISKKVILYNSVLD